MTTAGTPAAPPSLEALVRVRYATISDVDDVASLFDAYRQFYRQPSNLEAARDFLAARLSREESAVLVATLDGPRNPDAGVVGFAQLYPCFSSVSVAPIVILNDLFVSPSARRLGVAGCLIDAAEAHARRALAVRLELATQHENVAALWLYHAKGFIPDAEFTHLSLTLLPMKAVE